MKKIFAYSAIILATTCFAACKGNTGQTGGAQADSGQTNVGSSGAADSVEVSAGSGTPQPVTTGGTDTSSIGKGATAPTVDTTKSNPK